MENIKITKKCSKCLEEKPNAEFKKAKRAKSGLFSSCKSCEVLYRQTRLEIQREYNKKYYSKNKEAILEWSKVYHYKYREKFLDYQRTYHKNRRTEQAERDMLSRVKSRAKKLGIPFNLELEDIIIPNFCPVLGIPITKNVGAGMPLPGSPSIDRLNPNLGYIKGNIHIISNRANTVKNNSTLEELEKVIYYIKNKT